MMLKNICIRHNLSNTDQNINMRLCLRSYCDAINVCIFKYFLFSLSRFMGRKPAGIMYIRGINN